MAPPSKALHDFVAEAQEIIDGLSKDLLVLSRSSGGEADPELLNRIFRAAHSLKGLASMFGVGALARLAHGCEDLLDDVRMGRVSVGEPLLDLLLEGVDVFQKILAEVGRGEQPESDGRSDARVSGLAARIQALRGAAPAATPADPLDAVGLEGAVRAVLTEYEEHRLRENVRKGVALMKVRASFELTDFDKGLADLNGRLKPLGEVISTLPSSEAGPAAGISFDLIFGSGVAIDRISAALQGLPAAVHPLGPAPAVPATGAASPAVAPSEAAPRDRPREPERRGAPEAETSLRSVSQTVRVDIAKLDRLMNIVGELVLAKTNLQRLSEGLRSGTPDNLPEIDAELQRETRGLERKLDALQKGILEVRMVPLEQVFDKLARMVRRVAREAGKEIDFRIAGGDVELDKLIVEELSDPLMHIIRNSIDHGVEAPEAREAAGKPRRGLVSLTARQKGNHVLIEVGDDGAGLDEEAIVQTAIDRGLTSPQAARDLTRRDILNFIFMPGFSTAKKVSQLSGRGVGLDVVKTNISNLSGIIDVRSVRGQGTAVSITLPVTLAIIRALIVTVSGRTYALPLNSVLEILAVEPRQVRTIETREVIDVRGTTLPLVRLSRLFRLSGERQPGKVYVVVVGLAQERLGIAVDELVGQQDVVVKPLGEVLADVRGIAGATDLGNRRTVLVLDVGGIIEEVFEGERMRSEPAAMRH